MTCRNGNNWNRLRPKETGLQRRDSNWDKYWPSYTRVVDPIFCVVPHRHRQNKYANVIWNYLKCAQKKEGRKRKSIHIKKQYHFRLCLILCIATLGALTTLTDINRCMFLVFVIEIQIRMHVMCGWVQRKTELSHDPFYFPHRQSFRVGISMHGIIRLSNWDKTTMHTTAADKKYYP